MQRIVAEEKLEVLHPEFGTRPRVYYRNLARFRTLFIGGAVAGELAGTLECLEGAAVTLERAGEAVATARTDAYGDFKFSGLAAGSGAYRLSIVDARFAPKSIEVRLGDQSIYLGDIRLAPRASGAQTTAGAAARGAVPTP
jgi:hypothetical protein